MNARVNGLLENIRKNLDEDPAFGPEQPGVVAGSHGDSQPGEGGADNIPDTEDALDKYLNGCIESVVDECSVAEDDAIDFVFGVADELAEKGKLPEMPDEDADDEDIALWLGKANTIGFQQVVLKAARDEMNV